MKKKRNTGQAPGSIKYTGNVIDNVSINYIEYDANDFLEEISNPENVVFHESNVEKVQWYDIRGLHNEDLILAISNQFKMHPLAIEDAVDVRQKPNYTEYGTGHFISLKSISFEESTQSVEKETIGIYFGEGFVLTFQENSQDLFESVRHRIKSPNTRIRRNKADYLAYAITDFVVDNYFTIVDKIEDNIELLETSITLNADETDRNKIFNMKKEVMTLRKSVAPLREVLNQFSRSDSNLIQEKTTTYIKDVYDHTIQIIDSIDTLREILSGLQDLYVSEVSLRMNKIMQFLTIITALFVPLSFLTGLYGMNFDYIPELKYQNGYFILWGFMVIGVIGMIIYFKKKNWF